VTKGHYIRRQDFDAFEHTPEMAHPRWYPIVRVAWVREFLVRSVLAHPWPEPVQVTSSFTHNPETVKNIRFANYHPQETRRSRLFSRLDLI
jgi:hypothetical protein